MTDEGVPLAQLEVTVPADAPPEVVFDHVAKVEGLGLVDDLAQDWRGGRALILVAPDAQDGTLITLVADSPADPTRRPISRSGSGLTWVASRGRSRERW